MGEGLVNKLEKQIICMVDTGACEDSIVKDVLEYNDEFPEQEIRDYIKEMLNNGKLVDRGPYLVYKR